MPIDNWYKIVYYYNMTEKQYKKDALFDAKLYSFMLESDLREWLQEEAKKRKISVSQLMREAIENYMKLTKAGVLD